MMEILLRTASTLARACSEAAQRIEVRPTIRLTINQFATTGSSEMTDRLQKEVRTAVERIDDVVSLNDARSEIRRLIGNANDAVVDRLLAQRDCLNANEKYLTGILDDVAGPVSRRRGMFADSNRVEHNAVEICAALANIRQRIATVTTAGEVTDYVDVPTLPKAAIDELRAKVAVVRRQRTALNDELAAANLSKRITLPDWVVEVLRKHQIIE